MLRNRTFRPLLASASLVLLSGPAFALDGADLVSKLNASYAASGFTVGYANADVAGSTITLKGVNVKSSDGKTAQIGDVTLDGVKEDGEGGYTIDTVAFPDINQTENDTTIVANDLQLTGVAIPAGEPDNTLDSLLMYESASAGSVTLSEKGKQVFSLSGIEANVTPMDNDAGIEFDATVSDINADLSQVEDPKAKDTIQKLGIQSLKGEVTVKGSWELASGKVTLDEYAFDFANLGRLNLSLGLSGYTPDFIKGMQDAMKASQDNPNKEEANAALGMSMMGLVQQLTFNNASISFEDASLTKKLLEIAGAEQGVSGDQMAQSLKGLVPLMMAQLNMPELQNQVSQALTTYLDDPKNLTITAEPEKPVPFPMIMGAAMGAPNTIPQVLGVTVTANE
ncbi:hypothetical protein [Sinorhizobium sp. BG8]|uniref:hypothetical protein n=1 Tax=Sinorhizobium sp. BG8 TaxID=2613773 RepID=UPI00193C931E|nr:hypothetical protein [Sinorhizobium sp. BG8]QRM54934.1 DUF945 domain-containing protein [Sinorhizobium sp. BG8]